MENDCPGENWTMILQNGIHEKWEHRSFPSNHENIVLSPQITQITNLPFLLKKWGSSLSCFWTGELLLSCVKQSKIREQNEELKSNHLPSWRSSEKTAVREMLSLSKALRPEKGPEENIEDVPSDSKVVDDCLQLGRTLAEVMESWYSVTRCTILSDCTTSPIVGRWLASGATQAAAIVQTRTKSSFGYLPPSFGSASSSSRSLSLSIGLAWKYMKRTCNLFCTYDETKRTLMTDKMSN